MSEFKAICDEDIPIAAPVVIVQAESDDEPAHIRIADAEAGDKIAGIALEHGRVNDVIMVLASGEWFRSAQE